MSVRVGINGFGRIGRQSLKAIIERQPEIEVVAVNDLADVELNALLFAHDSTYGRYPGSVDHTEDSLIVDGRQIKVLKEKDPAALPWGELGIDIVIESTGFFTTGEKARAHLDAGARKVIISAPAKGEDITIVLGVNEEAYDPRRTTSSATPRARPTAWRRSPRCSTTRSASRRASSRPSTATPTRSACSTSSPRTRATLVPPRRTSCPQRPAPPGQSPSSSPS